MQTKMDNLIYDGSVLDFVINQISCIFKLVSSILYVLC